MQNSKIGDLIATSNALIVKIFTADKDARNTSVAGLNVENQHKPLMNMCQMGEVISVGENLYSDYKPHDIILFSHSVEDDTSRYLGSDESGEYRIVKETIYKGEIYGTIKTNKKSGYSHIQPKRHYALAIPEKITFDDTNHIFQIPIAALHPNDAVVKKMGIKVDDWVIVEEYGAYQIFVKRNEFWFIHLENILAINRGHHKLAIDRKYVSEYLRQASTVQKAYLN